MWEMEKHSFETLYFQKTKNEITAHRGALVLFFGGRLVMWKSFKRVQWRCPEGFLSDYFLFQRKAEEYSSVASIPDLHGQRSGLNPQYLVNKSTTTTKIPHYVSTGFEL